MPPVVIAGAIAGAGAIGAAAIGSNASKKATQANLSAQQQQILNANQNRDYQYSLNSPAIGNGNAADARIAALLNLGGDQAGAQAGLDAFKESTGYASRLNEGLQATNQRAFAGGMGQSGAALQALQRTGQNYASNEFGNYLGQLGGVSATGANARGLVAGVGSNATNQLINASQNFNNNQQQIIANQAANGQNLVGNLVNAGLFAYGSSFAPKASPIAAQDPSRYWGVPY